MAEYYSKKDIKIDEVFEKIVWWSVMIGCFTVLGICGYSLYRAYQEDKNIFKPQPAPTVQHTPMHDANTLVISSLNAKQYQ